MNTQFYNLVNTTTGATILCGEHCIDFRGEHVTLVRTQSPTEPNKSGYVTVRYEDGSEWTVYPAVIGCKFVAAE